LEFAGIVEVVADVVDVHLARPAGGTLDVAAVLAADGWARAAATDRIDQEQ
jgi:1-deoxy-D-xylulose-5-phosphate reductoisomerase